MDNKFHTTTRPKNRYVEKAKKFLKDQNKSKKKKILVKVSDHPLTYKEIEVEDNPGNLRE